MHEPIKILLIDDDEDEGRIFTYALASIDSDVEFRHMINGQEALDLLEQKFKPDIIFLDINMPKLDGWQVLRALQSESYRDIPVIMHSSMYSIETIKKAFEDGACGFLSKIISSADFNKILSMLLNPSNCTNPGTINGFTLNNNRKLLIQKFETE
ncbi:MAG: response regulator [Bacteroidetes bacterium]|nr:response regulator [Bacteroidota bacterium]